MAASALSHRGITLRLLFLTKASFLLLLVLGLLLAGHHRPHSSPRRARHLLQEAVSCEDLHRLPDHGSICAFLNSREVACAPSGFIDYLQFFYCACWGRPLLGYALLGLWLLVLFYLLGNTASVYFCSSLEGLSAVLRLPPTIAGVTLLSLGNGAPDLFSSVVSFTGSGVGEVGVSGVLGGAFFVSSVVVGVIGFVVDARSTPVDRACFVRDICFFLLTLATLLAILVAGRISIWGAMAFMSLYVAYVVLTWAGHFCKHKRGELEMPILDVPAEEGLIEEGAPPPQKANSPTSHRFCRLLRLLELPLYLPRRLTIPDASEERWSKPFAVASASLAPLFVASLWVSQRGETSSDEKVTIYLTGSLIGLILGVAAMKTTERASPPKRCRFPWLAGGFLMSVIWSYMIADELVSLLVSIGDIAGISQLVLGVTVLAWGNSLGDLIANLALALGGGRDGIQIAISGCYAGPIFNTLVGLGAALVLAAGAAHPEPLEVPRKAAIFETLGFLAAGLLWALVMLPRRGMKPDRYLGTGLLAIYSAFLCLRLLESLEIVKLLLPCLGQPKAEGGFFSNLNLSPSVSKLNL